MYKFFPILLFAYGLALTTEDIYDNSYALIIGIDKYENVQPLNYAVKDAEIIHEMLVTLFDFPEENITILKNEEANKQSILKVFSEITTKAEKNDRVLIYFAGHGDTFPLPNDEGDMGYLIPVDCNYDNISLSSISMQSVYDIIDESVGKHILLLIDAATSGFPSNREYEGVIDPSTADYIQKIKEAKVRQIITAGSKDEKVIERAEWGHSAFTMNLLRGLRDNLADSNKDGFVTGYELGLFLKNTTLDRTDNHQMSKSIRMSSDKGEFVLINNNYGKKDENLYSINRDDIYDDSWAVIIGIDKYKYSDQLNYAVKDAEAVKDMLINKFDYPEENIRYLVDEQATLSEIKLALGEVATSAGENDRILVFYSGHGETLIGADNSEKGYIIPFEGKQDNPYATGIAMDEILTTSQISKSKHMLFLMDACYSGLMTEHVKGLSKPKEDGYLSKVANEKARQIITAGGNEPAIEGGRWNHSVFTKNLLEGLDDWAADTDSDGYITADELGTYLRKSVTEDSNNQQTPQKGRFINSGGGEFVFFSDATVTIPSSDTDEEDEIVYGCMDESANNYNPNATNPDRSCQYGQLVTSLEFGEIININKIIGTDINIPDGKTGENYVDGYFIVYEVPVIINNNSDIAGFQFEIDGGNIIQASGGIAEEYGFMTSHSESMVLSYSLNGDVFPPAGNQVLLDLQIEPIWYTSIIGTTGVVTTKYREVCIQEIILSDKYAHKIKSTSFDCFKPVFPTR